MAAFAPKSTAALRVEAEVIKTLKEILAADGYPDAEIITSTVRVLNKDVLECCFHVGPACYTAELCCSARKVLNTEPGMPA